MTMIIRFFFDGPQKPRIIISHETPRRGRAGRRGRGPEWKRKKGGSVPPPPPPHAVMWKLCFERSSGAVLAAWLTCRAVCDRTPRHAPENYRCPHCATAATHQTQGFRAINVFPPPP
jgi:hypothetical protein